MFAELIDPQNLRHVSSRTIINYSYQLPYQGSKGYSSSPFGHNSGGVVDIPVVGEALETLVVGACLTELEVEVEG